MTGAYSNYQDIILSDCSRFKKIFLYFYLPNQNGFIFLFSMLLSVNPSFCFDLRLIPPSNGPAIHKPAFLFQSFFAALHPHYKTIRTLLLPVESRLRYLIHFLACATTPVSQDSHNKYLPHPLETACFSTGRISKAPFIDRYNIQKKEKDRQNKSEVHLTWPYK